ncbi:MAG: hypothetical protein ACE145_20525 [Terriglobia bacterium]
MLLQLSESISRQELVELVRLASLAPSLHNSQPWKFLLQDCTIKIYPDFTRRLPVEDPDDHALFISLGCALENLLIAARHMRFVPEVDYNLNTEPHDCLTVLLRRGSTEVEAPLFKAIPERQTTWGGYGRQRVPLGHLKELMRATEREGVYAWLLVEKEDIDPVIELARESTRIQFARKDFLRELTSWIRFNRGEVEAHQDGLTYAALGMPSVPRWLGKLLINALAVAEWQVRQCGKLIRTSSAMLVFTARENNKISWVQTGRSLERMALAATSLGIRYALVNAPCQVLYVRKQLQRHLGLTEDHPLLLVRVGYAHPMPRSPRRPVQGLIL